VRGGELMQTIAMPAPSVWPFVTAFGLTLVFAGLVTHVVVSLAGVLLLGRGAIGWWSDVLPVERHETVTIGAFERDPAIHVSSRAVEHLAVGVGGHRVRIPAEVHPYSSGLSGAVVGAIAMALVAIAYGIVSQHSVWYVVNLLAAGVVPSLSAADLEALKAFSATGLAVGCVLHAILSALVGVLYAVLLPMFPRRAGIWSGLVTPIVWTGLVKASLDVVNPTLNGRIDWFWFIASQIAFGLMCGFVVARTERIETMQSWTWENRAGLEARRGDEE
jgi:hypothetical protein